jgi:hypothetical protein
MFLCKQARQDVLPGIVYLATRVKEPNNSNRKKLVRLMNYLQATKTNIAKMSADNTQTIKSYVNLSFAVHKDMRSHTGAIMTLGKGAIFSNSTKQKVNARSLTKSKMIATDNTILKVLWANSLLKLKDTT